MNGEALPETTLNNRINRYNYTSTLQKYTQGSFAFWPLIRLQLIFSSGPIPQIPMGFEVLTPRAEGEDLLLREEDTVLLPEVGYDGPVPTFNLPFMKFQAVIRLKGKSGHHLAMNDGLRFLRRPRSQTRG